MLHCNLPALFTYTESSKVLETEGQRQMMIKQEEEGEEKEEEDVVEETLKTEDETDEAARGRLFANLAAIVAD